MADPNLELLRSIALTLRPLCERLVFVGGCATDLQLTNSAAANLRPTEDVDAIIDGGLASGLLAHPEMQNAPPGLVEQPMRAGIVLLRLQQIASLISR